MTNKESNLPVLLQNSYYRQKARENLHDNPILTRLLQKEKKQDLDHNLLSNESNIRKNKLVIEHIIKERRKKDYESDLLAEL